MTTILRLVFPYVEGAKVTASVVCEGKGKKVIVYKYKPKKGFHKKERSQTAIYKASDQQNYSLIAKNNYD